MKKYNFTKKEKAIIFLLRWLIGWGMLIDGFFGTISYGKIKPGFEHKTIYNHATYEIRLEIEYDKQEKARISSLGEQHPDND